MFFITHQTDADRCDMISVVLLCSLFAVIARVKDCVQFVHEDYGATRFRMLCSDASFPIVSPSLSELEGYQTLEMPSRVGDQAGHQRETWPRFEQTGVDIGFSGASCNCTPIPFDFLPECAIIDPLDIADSPTGDHVAMPTPGSMDEGNQTPGDRAINSCIMGLAGVSTTLA